MGAVTDFHCRYKALDYFNPSRNEMGANVLTPLVSAKVGDFCILSGLSFVQWCVAEGFALFVLRQEVGVVGFAPLDLAFVGQRRYRI